MTPDKKIGIPMAVPIIGGEQQKVSMDEVIQKLMQNIHQLNTDYQTFAGAINDLNTKVTVLESRLIRVFEMLAGTENKQVAFPSKIEVIVKNDMAQEAYKEWKKYRVR